MASKVKRKEVLCECGHCARAHEGWCAPGKDEPGCCEYVSPGVFCSCDKWRPKK